MSRRPYLSLRKIAEVAVDYETSGDSMRAVAGRHDVSQPSVYRSVQAGREAVQSLESQKRFDLQRHVAEVLVESAELHAEVIAIMRQRVRNDNFVEKQSGRDWAALAGVLAKENRATLDYIFRTFGGSTGNSQVVDVSTQAEPDTHE